MVANVTLPLTVAVECESTLLEEGPAFDGLRAVVRPDVDELMDDELAGAGNKAEDP
jgi:hypothetical protein